MPCFVLPLISQQALKPCPICSKIMAKLEREYQVRCSNCKAETQHLTQTMCTTTEEQFEIGQNLAIDLWNRRVK
jgi:hypothetical protein